MLALLICIALSYPSGDTPGQSELPAVDASGNVLPGAENMYRLGTLYLHGHAELVHKDLPTAMYCFEQAASAGHYTAAAALGMIYYEGRDSVRVDRGVAAQWFVIAANGRNTYAIRHLSAQYAVGDGVPQDDYTAYVWGLIYHQIRGRMAALDHMPPLRERLTPAQLASAKGEASAWLAAH